MIISIALNYLFIRYSAKLGIVDIPNHRSLHEQIKPRTGGLAILSAISVGFLFFYPFIDESILLFLPYILFLAIIAFVDDIYSISAASRLLLQLILACLLIYEGFMIESFNLLSLNITLPSFVAVISTILFIVWLINLYNFMDGMDGFSAGMAIFGFCTFALLAYLKGEEGFMIANLILVFGILGFLLFNLPPSKIFMGDIGSTVIGMFVALYSIWANNNGVFPIYISVIIFAPFILDATITLIKRTFRGEKIWVAHRSHYYQRLVLSGLGHKKTLFLEYIWMLLCSIFAVAIFKYQNFNIQNILLILFIIMCLVILVSVDIKTRNVKT